MTTQLKLDEFNKEISTKLDVDKLKLELIITDNVGQYGSCMFMLVDESFKIRISKFIVGSILEDYTLKHEIAHAYDFAYMPKQPNPHGIGWTEIMKQVWGFKNVTATGFDLCNLQYNIDDLIFVKDWELNNTPINYTYHVYSKNLLLGTFIYVDESKWIVSPVGGKRNLPIIEKLFIDKILEKVE
jgi:predicted SprT family Zn-dependent metalloprotease